jgi:RimJ/RimL family protein N-acetyltransferase
LKIATPDDFEEIRDMAMKFMDTTGYTAYSDEETISKLINNILTGKQDEMIILLKPGVGFLAGMASAFPFGPQLIASEIAWWINEDQRKGGAGAELVDAFEYWAKNIAGCTMITLTSLDDKVGKFYEKKGYELYERAYMKQL